MPFTKGHKLATGRPEGSLNKKTREAKERIDFVLGLLDETIEEDLKAVTPKQRVLTYVDLQEFKSPKLARVDSITANVKVDEVYTDDQADRLLKLRDDKR